MKLRLPWRPRGAARRRTLSGPHVVVSYAGTSICMTLTLPEYQRFRAKLAEHGECRPDRRVTLVRAA